MNAQSNADSRPGSSDDNRLQEIGRDIGQNAQVLARSVEAGARELEVMLRQQVERRPYGVLAAAVGIGYILGGGLPSRVTSLLFGIGSRVALAALARELSKQQLGSSSRSFTSRAEEETQENGVAY